MIRREMLRRKRGSQTDELTLGEAISEMLMTMGTEVAEDTGRLGNKDQTNIAGETAICVMNRREKQTAYYKAASKSESDEFDFLRLWCFARVLQVLSSFYRGWQPDIHEVKRIVRRAAFGRQVPPLVETRFQDMHGVVRYCMQWMLGRDIPQLKNDFGGNLSVVCGAFAREIDHSEPLEEALDAIF